MKAAMILCFVVGLLLGWRLEAIMAPDEHAEHPGRAGSAGTSGHHPTAREKPAPEEDRVDIPREKMLEMVASGRSPALSANDFAGEEEGPLALEMLGAWVDLDARETILLAEILRGAARERVAWEKANVRVQRDGSKWTLDYPSDGGEARDQLKAALARTFTPAKARAIEVMGDLGNFFGFGNYAPEFRHGTVQITVQRINKEGVPSDKGLELEYEINISSPWVKHREGVNASDPLETGAMRRFAGLLER